jgi:RNA methyltransferase, TrmH family
MIASAQNKKLKDIRRLRRSKGERAVLEGPHLLREALLAGVPLELVLVTPELAAGREGSELLRRLPCPALEVSSAVLPSITDADSPRGAVAVAHLPRGGAQGLPVEEGAVYLYLEGVQDPGNLGALARLAEAAGVAGMACSPGCAHPNHPRALRASAGSLLRLPVAIEASPAAVQARLRPARPTWVALVAHGGEGLYDAVLKGALVLVVGAEGGGVSPALRAHARRSLEIPLEPPVESLNVAAAAAVVLFELRRRQRATSPAPRESPG